MLLACFSKQYRKRVLASMSVDSMSSDISFESVESAPTIYMELDNKLSYAMQKN